MGAVIALQEVPDDVTAAAGPESFDRIQAASIQGMPAFGEAAAYVGKAGRGHTVAARHRPRVGTMGLAAPFNTLYDVARCRA